MDRPPPSRASLRKLQGALKQYFWALLQSGGHPADGVVGALEAVSEATKEQLAGYMAESPGYDIEDDFDTWKWLVIEVAPLADMVSEDYDAELGEHKLLGGRR